MWGGGEKGGRDSGMHEKEGGSIAEEEMREEEERGVGDKLSS